LKAVIDDYENTKVMGKKQAYIIKSEFSLEKMQEKLQEILDKTLPEFPKHIPLKLPSLKKIELPSLKKV
jgi:hypothetical protein